MCYGCVLFFCFCFFKQKTAYEMRISDWRFRRVLFRSIRGDDHLNNAFRQLGIVKAMSWPEPIYAHVPLIHGQDGAKMSKRHGATGVENYRDELGMLPEALSNYLLRLGWGHGDEEIISQIGRAHV